MIASSQKPQQTERMSKTNRRHQEQPRPPATSGKRSSLGNWATTQPRITTPVFDHNGQIPVGNRLDENVWVRAGQEQILDSLLSISRNLQACRDAIQRKSEVAKSPEGTEWMEQLDSRLSALIQLYSDLEGTLKGCLDMKVAVIPTDDVLSVSKAQAESTRRLYTNCIRKICDGELEAAGNYKEGVTNDKKIKNVIKESYEKVYRSVNDYGKSLRMQISGIRDSRISAAIDLQAKNA